MSTGFPRRGSAVAPELRDGVAGWTLSRDGVRFAFLGRGTPGERQAPLPAAWLPAGVGRARLKQVHGDAVLEARAGACGEGDALVSARTGLALEIATADCVPILLAGAHRIGAVHAGWRGIAAGVVARAVERFDEPGRLFAAIGPAIGPCCYEVEESVAEAVAVASPGAAVVARRSERGRPMLDLQAAVAAQLAAAGVTEIETLTACTRHHPEWLWSYRRDGAGAGRNLALVWRD